MGAYDVSVNVIQPTPPLCLNLPNLPAFFQLPKALRWATRIYKSTQVNLPTLHLQSPSLHCQQLHDSVPSQINFTTLHT